MSTGNETDIFGECEYLMNIIDVVLIGIATIEQILGFTGEGHPKSIIQIGYFGIRKIVRMCKKKEELLMINNPEMDELSNIDRANSSHSSALRSVKIENFV
jgi:hypothetical protein